MANGNILFDLLERIGRGKGKVEAGEQRATESINNAVNLLGQLIRSGQQAFQAGKQQTAPQLNPLQENVLKTVQKSQTEQVEEALAAGTSGEEVLKNAGISIATNQPTDEEGKTEPTLALTGVQPPELTSVQASKDLIQGLAKAPRGLLTKLLGPTTETLQAEATLKNQQLANLISGQQVLGQQPLQKGEKEKLEFQTDVANIKQNRLDQREILKARLKSLGTVDELGQSAQLFQDDLFNLVSAFEAIPIKGRGLGAIGAIGAGTLGIGRQKRAEFQALSELFVFSVGEFIAKQTGRALDQKDIKRLEKLGKFKTGDTRGIFKGKLQAIIRLANSRLKQAGKPDLPDVDTFIKQIKQGRQQAPTISSRNIKSITEVK